MYVDGVRGDPDHLVFGALTPVLVPSVVVALPFGVLSSLLALWILGEGLQHLRFG